MIALAFREGRIKNRDLWDIGWLVQQGTELPLSFIPLKINDHQRSTAEFNSLLGQRVATLHSTPQVRDDFLKEMGRLLPASTVRDTLGNPEWWTYLTGVVAEQARLALSAVAASALARP